MFEREKDLAEREKNFEEMKVVKANLEKDIDRMNKEVLMLNNEIKSKQNVVKKAKPGAPTPRPANALAPLGNHEKGAAFVDMKDELEEKSKLIEQLNDKIIVQDHELQQLRSLKENLNRLKDLEDQLDHKDQTISELKKKVVVQEEAIASWIEAMEEKKNLIKE